MTGRFKKIIYLICACLVFGACFYLLLKVQSNVEAESLQVSGLSQGKFVIKDKKLIKRGFFKNKVLTLSGFENRIRVCDFEGANLLQKEDMICLLGDVGAHSQNLALIDAGSFNTINFIKGGTQMNPNIYSDLPSFRFSNNYGVLGVDVFYRDYDKNPLVDFITETYVLKNGKFILTK